MIRLPRLLGALLLACGALFAVAAPANAGAVCSEHVLNVRNADPGPADQTLHGWLCYPHDQRPAAVQLLVHGAAYNHVYWDFPVNRPYYSYVKAATAAGYATFNVDRIGAGASSHPPSAQVTVPGGAVALHDAITALRSGALDGHAFQRVLWVGHSLGSGVAWYEVPPYHDVDGLILTGILHALNPSFVSYAYPANQDPKFAGLNLDSGYLTTKPGTRGLMYYYAATADPQVVAADEATKDVATAVPPPPVTTPYQIKVPVLLVMGEKDDIHCTNVTQYDCTDAASVRAFESQYYLPETRLQVETVPETGHDLALSTTAPATDTLMLRWARANVAP